jgi:hypothetical protein
VQLVGTKEMVLSRAQFPREKPVVVFHRQLIHPIQPADHQTSSCCSLQKWSWVLWGIPRPAKDSNFTAGKYSSAMYVP